MVSLTVVVRVIVLRVVEWTSLEPAGTGWARPVEECESPAACELSASGMAWFCATV